MCALSSSPRPVRISEASSDAGDVADSFTRKDYYEQIIELADTVPLLKVFKRYNIYCNEAHHTIRCPFKSHKDGTASFKYYHETNSFRCFGCHTGAPFAHACHFIAAMDGISLQSAASKILEVFRDDIGEVSDDILLRNDGGERLEIMLDFSNAVREFYRNYQSEDAWVYVELACKAYDMANLKHNFDNNALRRTVEQLKAYISSYVPQL